jgi:hypothetical protein
MTDEFQGTGVFNSIKFAREDKSDDASKSSADTETKSTPGDDSNTG